MLDGARNSRASMWLTDNSSKTLCQAGLSELCERGRIPGSLTFKPSPGSIKCGGSQQGPKVERSTAGTAGPALGSYRRELIELELSFGKIPCSGNDESQLAGMTEDCSAEF